MTFCATFIMNAIASALFALYIICFIGEAKPVSGADTSPTPSGLEYGVADANWSIHNPNR